MGSLIDIMVEFTNAAWAWLLFGSSWMAVVGCFWSAWDVARYGNAYYGWGGRKPTKGGYWRGLIEGFTTGSFMFGIGLLVSALGDGNPRWSPKAFGWLHPHNLLPMEQFASTVAACMCVIMLLSAVGAWVRVAMR